MQISVLRKEPNFKARWLKGTIWEEGDDIRDLTYDWDDHIIKINNLTMIKWLLFK